MVSGKKLTMKVIHLDVRSCPEANFFENSAAILEIFGFFFKTRK
jgi:hypothetical protein